MNIAAGLALVLWVATAVAGSLALLIGVRAWCTQDRERARQAAVAGGRGLALYVGLLLTVSLSSRERVLEPGDTKYFCGVYLDCHLGVKVAHTRRTRSIGDGPARLDAAGTFQVVGLRFLTTAMSADLRFRAPRVELVDDVGRRYRRSLAAEDSIEASAARTDLERSLRPEGSFVADFVFDVPPEARGLRVAVREGPVWLKLSELFLVGDDDSWLHAPTTLALHRNRRLPSS